MSSQLENLLTEMILPARCSAERAARYLGFSAHEIPILVQKGLLTPLGHPARNNVRFFAAVKLQELRQDVKWLAKATDATSEAWRIKNRQERRRQGTGRPTGIRRPISNTESMSN